jgi:ankyrin repeat protein
MNKNLIKTIIEYSKNYDDLEYIYNNYCYFQDLIWNIKTNETLIFYSIKNNNVILFDFLIDKKCNVNYINKYDTSPLQSAIIQQYPNFVKKLIENNANINYKNNSNIGPLSFLYMNKYKNYDLRNNKQKEIEEIILTYIKNI